MFIFRVFFLLYFAGNSIGRPFSNKTDHDGLVTRFDDLVNRFKREFGKIIEGDRSKMKAEVEAFNAEKRIMKGIEVNNDDIIQLNVGGQSLRQQDSPYVKLMVRCWTLCLVETGHMV